jgi:hypothetical protein
MKYRELLEALKALSPEQLEFDVTVYDPYPKEALPVADFYVLEDGPADHRSELSDVLEPKQPILLVSF